MDDYQLRFLVPLLESTNNWNIDICDSLDKIIKKELAIKNLGLILESLEMQEWEQLFSIIINNSKDVSKEVILSVLLFKDIIQEYYDDTDPFARLTIQSNWYLTAIDYPVIDSYIKYEDNLLGIKIDEIINDKNDTNLPSLPSQMNLDEKLKILFALNNNFSSIDTSRNYYLISNFMIANQDIINVLNTNRIIKRKEVIHQRVLSTIDYCDRNLVINYSLDNHYSQFIDTLNGLSEFNSEERIITKFLYLYQIFESFEIRIVIGEHLKNHASLILTPALLQGISSRAKKELEQLNNFMMKISKIQYLDQNNNLNTIESLIVNEWQNRIGLISNFQDLDNIFLEISSGNNEIKFTNNLPNNYNKISDKLATSIYAIRCAIVHAKTATFHLNDTELGSPNRNELKKYIENVLMPIMYFVIVKLISSPGRIQNQVNNLLYYESRNINLY